VARDIVLLHGFAGTSAMWDPLLAGLDPKRYRALAVDLPGHGAAKGVRPVTFETCVEHVIACAPERFDLCGYSMGGRVALHVGLAHPGRVDRLILVATSPGLEGGDARAARRASDEELAARIERGTIEQFADAWTSQPLFAGDPPSIAAAWRADLVRNEPQALAAVLRGIGTGLMTPLWGRLGELQMPALVVVGERDLRYRAIAEHMAAALADARVVVVPGAGHGIPREAPEALAALLNEAAPTRSE
jgi:2-succinyl-6-hydroxy-2,4-cyclohexadiene-1-carboxylate synthase